MDLYTFKLTGYQYIYNKNTLLMNDNTIRNHDTVSLARSGGLGWDRSEAGA